MSDYTLLVADDHPLFLRGIVDFIHQIQYRDILTAHDGLSAFRQIVDCQPDVAILDIEMPYLTGLEVAQKTRDKGIATKFVLISYQQDAMLARMADELNISAYILKEDSLSLLDQCLQSVLRGEKFFSPGLLPDTERTQLPSMPFFTPTEKRILRLIAADQSSKQIAETYGVSVRTIEKHRSNIIQKLDLPTGPTALNKWARKHKNYF